VRRGSIVGAAVDLGSNSVHLLVAEVRGHDLVTLADESAFLGLGTAVDDHGEFGEELRDRLVETLVTYARLARRLGAHTVTLVGTDPLRRATDAPLVLTEVERASGLAIDVVDQTEEALLTLVGVTAGRPVLREVVVVDLGGGSSEFLVVSPEREEPVVAGLPIGSNRLTRTFAESDPPTPGELSAMLDEARRIVDEAPDAVPAEVVVVGGTAENLARIVGARAVRPTLTRRRVAEAMTIAASEPAEAIAARHGIRVPRARMLPAGAAIVAAIIERYGVSRIRVVARGIREGTILAAVHAGPTWRDHLAWLAHGWSR
jgi:exopolyphosphatase/pppGpp-phosphohydrolase